MRLEFGGWVEGERCLAIDHGCRNDEAGERGGREKE